MKTLVTAIAASLVVSSIALSAGLAQAQTAPDTQKNSPAPTEQSKPARDPAKWEARHAKMIDRLFAKYDAQKSGVITVETFLKDADARFDKIDTKHQGFIDKDELAAYVKTSGGDVADRIMKRLDSNADGKITKDEFEKPMRKRFALLDLNDDGKITREEAELAGPASMMMPHHRNGDAQHRRQMMHNDKGSTQQ
jgi:Ca2+-binding EF-hand superfamily protein